MPTLTTNGASTKTPRTTDSTPAYATVESPYKGAGWVLFAGIMLAIAGSLNFDLGHRGCLELAFLRGQRLVHPQ